MDYALRIQALDGYASTMEKVFSTDRFSRTIRIHHTGKKGDNPHYHLLITTDYKQDALRKELKKHFTLATGNKHLSIKNWDGSQQAVAYLYHEGTTPDMIRGFTQEELSQAQDINHAVKERVKQNAPSKIVEEATAYFQGKTPYDKDVFCWIFKRLAQNGDWLPNKFQVERWILRIQANLRTGYELDKWIERQYLMWF